MFHGKKILSFILAITLVLGTAPAVGAQNNATITDASTVSVAGSNSIGTLISDGVADAEAEAEAAEAQYGGMYSITGLNIEGNIATVSYDAMEEATLLVTLHTEDGLQLLNTGKVTVSAEEKQACVTIEGEMPEYFEASAHLLDQYDLSPLCPSYTTPMYTRAMQELLTSTVDDYNPDLVLNLDENNNTNFAVCNESVVILKPDEGYNIVTSVDDAQYTYVFENPDEQLLGLSEGTVFVYSYEENATLIVKVSSVQQDGNTATVLGQALEIEEVFDYLKLETTGDNSQIQVDSSTCEEGVIFEGIIEEQVPRATRAWDDNISMKKSLSFTLEKEFGESGDSGVTASISGGLTLSAEAGLSYYISLRGQYVEVKVVLAVELGASFTGSLKQTGITLAEFTLPSPVAGVVFECAPVIIWQFDASANISGSVTMTLGFSYDGDAGFQNLCTKPEASFETTVEGKLFMGVELQSSICILDDDIASLGFTIRNGLQCSGKMTGTHYEGEPKENASKIHTCEKCLALRFDWVIQTSVWVKLIKIIKAEKTLTDFNFHLFKMYWSLSGENTGSGFGICPNYLYRVNVRVQDKAGDPIANQQVRLASGEVLGNTNKDGKLAVYLHAGVYNFVTTIDGEDIAVEREIHNSTRVVLTNNPEIRKKMEEYRSMLLTSLSISNHSTYGSGTLSGGIDWKLYRSGVLIISGDGVMESFSSASKTPWYNWRDKITAVELRGEISNVGSYAFSDCSNLKTVILPDSCVNLENYAFSGCTALSKLRLPVDYNCSPYTFQSCSGIQMIQYGCGQTGVMPDRNSSNSSYSYSYERMPEYKSKSSLKNIIFEDGISSVGSYAFYQTSVLENVYMADSIETIGSNAFSNSGIQSIQLPEALQSIGEYAFGSSALTEIEFPDSLQSIGASAFSSCVGLTELVIPDHLAKNLGVYAFQGCSGLTKISLPVDYTISFRSGYGVFIGCSNVQSIHYTAGITGIMTDRKDDYTGAGYYKDSLEYICRAKLKQITFDEGITRIGDYGFYCSEALETVELPSTLSTIGYHTFAASGIQNIQLPEGLQSIGEYAFANSSLAEIEFPDSLQSIGDSAFSSCVGLTELVIPDHLAKNLGVYAFQGCSGLTKISLPVDYTISFRSGYGVFIGCSNVQSIHYTAGITGIMTDRKDDYRGASYYKDTLEYICRANLKQITFDEGITRIGDYSFYCSEALETVELPSTLSTIGYHTFAASGIQNIQLPEGLQSIGEYAFANSSLTEIEFPDSLQSIGDSAFSSCVGLTELVIPDHLAKNLGVYAFQGCSGLTKISLPVDYTISFQNGYGVFIGCSNVQSIHYTAGITGIMTDRKDDYRGASYYKDTLEYICRAKLKQITFDEGITRIGNYGFYCSEALETVTLPSTLESLGIYAFGLSAAPAIRFTGNAPAISGDSFSGVTAITYYPIENQTWTDAVMQNYGGILTWTPTELPAPAAKKATSKPVRAETLLRQIIAPAQQTAELVTADQSAQNSAQEESGAVGYAIVDGTYDSEQLEEYILQSASFSELVPGGQYVLIAVKDPKQEDILADGNLLAVRQASAAEDGTLHISYVQREYTDISYVFAAGPSGKSLEDAEIQFPPMLAEETAQTVEPVVLYQGQPLTEELDYIVLGDVEYNEAGTYTCYIRGVREYFGLIPCTYTVVENRVTDWRLTLSDRVAMEFALSIDADTASSTQVTVSYSGTTVSYAADTLPWDSTIGAYLLCVPLDAPQMTESVYLEITVDGQLYSKKSYTVRQYADYILDDANSYDETVKNLVRELVYYGGMAQLYFGYNTENLASSGIIGAASENIPQITDRLSISGQVNDLKFYGAGLVYRDRIGVRFYFMGDVSDCSFTANDQTYTPVLKDGLYYVEIREILPQKLDAPITLTVTDASAETLTVTYSPILYIVRMHQKGNADLQALLKALYNYHLAAKAYQVQYF